MTKPEKLSCTDPKEIHAQSRKSGLTKHTCPARHANLKYKFGNRKFWAEGHCVSTVGMNEATIAKYIREQEAADIALDKLSVKEYEDPFSRK